MSGLKFQALIAVVITVFFVAPSVSAISIFGETDVYTIYYDEGLFNETRPGIIGIPPEKIYWRIMEKQGEEDIRYVVMFFYWAQQDYYMQSHEFDWEFFVMQVNDLNETFNVAYDEWHYIIGRQENPRLYEDTHVFINISAEYHPVAMYNENIFGNNVEDALNYSDIEVIRLDGATLKDSAEEIGFNENLANEPYLFFEKGWFGYKQFSAWRSWTRAVKVYVDRKLDWVDFSNK